MTSPESSNLTLPTRSSLDIANYPIAPQGLGLEQVHVYVRHGERTPEGSPRLSDPPASIPARWMMCKMASRFRDTMARFDGDAEEESARAAKDIMVKRVEGSFAEGECLPGQLTDLGKESTLNFGKALRALYGARLGFLPDTLKDFSEIYFRSTNIPRTLESVAQIIHGLYPPSKVRPDVSPQIFVRKWHQENLFANWFGCNRLKVLLSDFTNFAASEHNRILEPLDQKLSKYINGEPIRIDGNPGIAGITDTIWSSQAHGIKVPPEFEDQTTKDLMERAVMAQYFSVKTEEVQRLGIGSLLEELGNRMAYKAANGTSDPVKILVHGTHDTGIGPMLSTLDIFDERWPSYTASVTFELFKKVPPSSFLQQLVGMITSPFARAAASTPEEHFVRVRYQNRTLPLPACAEVGKHLAGSPEFCTLSAFLERVKEVSPKNWEAECMSNSANGQ